MVALLLAHHQSNMPPTTNSGVCLPPLTSIPTVLLTRQHHRTPARLGPGSANVGQRQAGPGRNAEQEPHCNPDFLQWDESRSQRHSFLSHGSGPGLSLIRPRLDAGPGPGRRKTPTLDFTVVSAARFCLFLVNCLSTGGCFDSAWRGSNLKTRARFFIHFDAILGN